MKRVWIALLIFVFLITICILGTNATKKISIDMIDTISDAKSAAIDENNKQAIKLSEKAVNDWENYHKVLCTFMPHSQLEAIDQTLSGMPMLCYYGTSDQFTAECDRCIIQIHYLNEAQLPNLANIF